MTSDHLRTIRRGLGLLQRELAEELGYAMDHIRHMENGQAKIPKRFEKQLDNLIKKKKLEKRLQDT